MGINEEERAEKLHQKAIVIDSMGYDPVVWSEQSLQKLNHALKADLPTWQIFERFDEMKVRDLINDEAVRTEYIRRYRNSGVTATNVTLGAFGRIPFGY